MTRIGQLDSANLNGMTPREFFSLLVTDVGQSVATRQARKDSAQDIMQQLNRRRDEVSGVDMNEEAAKLVVYERMFQAMAKVITTQDRALQTLMEIM